MLQDQENSQASLGSPITFARNLFAQAVGSLQSLAQTGIDYANTGYAQLSNFWTQTLTLAPYHPLCFNVIDPLKEDLDLEEGNDVAITDPRYYMRRLRRKSSFSSSSQSSDSSAELDSEHAQFKKDLNRCTQVLQDGAEVERSVYDTLFDDWTTAISVAHKLDPAYVKGFLVLFNQSFGNFSMCFWNQFIQDCTYKKLPIMMFRTLHDSDKFEHILSLDNSKLELIYNLPLQAFSAEPELMRESSNHEVDVMYKATLTCDFSLKPSDPGFFKHVVAIEVQNPNLTVAIRNKEAFGPDKGEFVVTTRARPISPSVSVLETPTRSLRQSLSIDKG